MLKQRENIVHRLFNRQICNARPNAHINEARKLYENIVPSHTVYDVECPDISFRKFTNDGQYLICFSRNQQDLVVYRHKWLNFCVKGEAADQLVNLPPKSKNFDAYFSHLYTIQLARATELICTDFFLSSENGLYGVFATSTPYNAGLATAGAIAGVPSSEKITIFLVSLADGRVTDQRTFQDDFIHLAHNMGAFLYDDLLTILSIRFQCIRIYQIRESGTFVDVRTIGEHCREDDELVLNSQAQEEELFKERRASFTKARGHPSARDLSEKVSDSGGNGWHPQWNIKQGQAAQRGQRTKRQSERSAPRSMDQSGRVERSDPSSSGAAVHQSFDNSDLEYDNYFRGLFASLENTAVNLVDVGRSTSDVQGSVNTANRAGTRLPRTRAAGHDLNNSRGEQSTLSGDRSRSATERVGAARVATSSFRISQNEGSVRTGMRVTLPLVDPATSTGSLQAHRSLNSYANGSGVHYPSSGPFLFRRPYSSSSGSSLDRSTSERGSASVGYTSTTMTSTDSGSRSVGSHRSSDGGNNRNISGSGRSFGNDFSAHQAGYFLRESNRGIGLVNGAPLAEQPEHVGEVEYVISSRVGTRGAGVSDQQVCPEEHSQSGTLVPGNSEMRTMGRSSRETRQSTPALDTLREEDSLDHHHHHHRWSNGHTDEPLSSDHTLPSGPGERIAGFERPLGHTVVSRRRPSRFHINNGTWGRGETIPEQAQRQTTGHDAESTGDGTERTRVGADAGGGGGIEQGVQVLGGIKQRLLSFIYQDYLNGDANPIAKAQRLKRYYYLFQNYLDLVMWKVQFLDRHHLLIKFGSVDGVLQRNSDTSDQNAFLAIFNLQTTEILGFYQNSSDEFFLHFEQFCDHFRVTPRHPVYMSYISSYSNNSYVRDQLRKQRMACSRSKAGSYSQMVKRTLAWVPFNSQCQSPSAYFDQYLFHYDEKLISAMDRHKPCMEHPIKFISRRRPNSLKFKINPGPELGVSDGRTKRYASFIFHPIFPFAISVQQSIIQSQHTIINFHFRK